MNIKMLGFMLALGFQVGQAHAGYKMGSAAVDITPPIGTPLAGYGGKDRRIIPWDFFNRHRYAHYLKPSTGVLDPIRAKSVVIELEQGETRKRALILSLDTVGTDDVFVGKIRKVAKSYGIDHVLVTATHTHSGPGALSKNKFYQLLAMDRFVPEVFEQVMRGTVQSITEAVVALEPVTLWRTQFSAMGFQRNRRGNVDSLDPWANLLIGRNAANQIVGGFVNYGVHPTVLGESNLQFSADLAGGFERQITRRLNSKGPVLFVNSVEGDVSPVVEGGYEKIDSRSAEFANLAADALKSAVHLPERMESRTGHFKMPKGKLRLDTCAESLPKFLRKISIGNSKWFPRGFELTHLWLGDVLLMTWPGEATVELGLQVRRIAKEYGISQAWNVGLANGYLGYFLSEADFADKGYETCVSYHGPRAGSVLIQQHERLLKMHGANASHI